MADVASGSIDLDYFPAEVYKGATAPESPADNQLWLDTSTANKILKRWDASADAWVIVADYNTMTEQIGAIQSVTTDSADFLGLLASAEYTENGLLLKGVGGTFSLLLGPSRIGFYQGGAEVAYITGNKLYITAAELIAELKIGNYIITSTADGGLAFK